MGSRVPTVHVFTKIPMVFETLQKKLPDVRVVNIECQQRSGSELANHTEPTTEEMRQLLEAEILVADPVIVCSAAQSLKQLKWMQSSWAGCDAMYNRLDKSKALPTFKLTRFAGCYGTAMSEWVIGQIIARERKFTSMVENQKKALWCPEGMNLNRTLPKVSVGILGMGDIGSDIARVCKAFRITVWGIKRNPVSDEERRRVGADRYLTMDQLPELLQSCDYVCNVLPSTPLTKGLLSGETLKVASSKKPVFINVGRGDIIDENSLLKALKQNWISGAILDVLPQEPLPHESLLWNMPNVVITPHISGTGEVAEPLTDFFCENYKRYQKGEPLKNTFSWEEGY